MSPEWAGSLSFDIVRAILAGTESDGLPIAKLTEPPIPEGWNEQRRLSPFPPLPTSVIRSSASAEGCFFDGSTVPQKFKNARIFDLFSLHHRDLAPTGGVVRRQHLTLHLPRLPDPLGQMEDRPPGHTWS